MEDELRRWVERAVGGAVTASRRTPSGGSRTTYLVNVERDGGTVPIVVRVEGEGSFTGSELTLQREAVAYRALHGRGVPVPSVLALSTDASAVILERVEGTDDLSTIGDDERRAILDDFATVLSDMHAIDPDTLDLPGFGRPQTAEEHARIDIEMWQRLSGTATELDPLIAYTGGWLHANAPATVQRTCFVQGDTGPGNFLAHDGRVSGLIDMEFAHVGDPIDDLAWAAMRVAGVGGDVAALFDAYSLRSGIRIDPGSLAFYELAVQYRCAVTTSLAVARGGGARGLSPYLLVTERYLARLATLLGERTGIAVAGPYEPDVAETPRTTMYDQLLQDIRTAVKAIDDSEVRETTRNAQILVHVLRSEDRYGSTVAQADADDRSRTPQLADLDDREFLQMATAAGKHGDLDVLAYLLRRRQRQAVLWRSLLDGAPRRAS